MKHLKFLVCRSQHSYHARHAFNLRVHLLTLQEKEGLMSELARKNKQENLLLKENEMKKGKIIYNGLKRKIK